MNAYSFDLTDNGDDCEPDVNVVIHAYDIAEAWHKAINKMGELGRTFDKVQLVHVQMNID